MSRESVSEVRDDMERRGQKSLDHLQKMAEDDHLDTKWQILEGDPHREIVDLEKRGVELIVMGHAGLRGPRRKIVGSVAERVIRFARCPVLVLGAGA